MNKLIGILVALSIILSGIMTVNADTTEMLLSTGKTVEAGISGSGDVHTDTHGFVENIVDGSADITYNQSQMWHLHSTVDEDIVWLNIDLQDSYVITRIVWTARYETTAKTDYKDVTVYGANKADFSDKTQILHTGSGENFVGQTNEFIVSEANECRYLRFERLANMGGIEIQVYGYKNPDTNANLKSLAIDGYTFDKEFSPNITEYTVISDVMPEGVTVSAETEEAEAVTDNPGTVNVNTGINEINIKVTSPDGTVTKTYTVNFIVTDITDISADCKVTAVNNAKNGDTDVFTQLFTSSVSRTAAWIFYTQTGYIDVDLGAEYSLSKIEWTKSNLEASGSLIIEGSKTADYLQTVTLGTTPAMDKETTAASGSLYSNEKYRYLRIRKDFVNAEFLPLQIRIYALPEIEVKSSAPKVKTDISSEVVSAVMYNVTKGDTNTSWATNGESGSEATPMELFTGSTTNTYIGYYNGYIDVDLGDEYNLAEFAWTRNGQMGSMRPLSIYASDDAEFTNPVLLGETLTDEQSCLLDSENAYRYVRIVKTQAADWYPNTIRLYALVDDESRQDDLITEVAVPGRYYSASDIIIAAVYNDGVLMDIETAVTFENEAQKKISVVTKAGDEIKLMIWKGLSNQSARIDAIDIR